MRSPVPSLQLIACATALAVAPARPCLAQASGRASVVRGVAVEAGVLAPARLGGALRLEEAAFDSGGTELTREAAVRLARAGGTLRALGAEPLRVVIYTADTTTVGARRASLRAVSVARALARGGYPVARLELEVAPPGAAPAGVGRILAGAPCVSGCVAPATRPPR